MSEYPESYEEAWRLRFGSNAPAVAGAISKFLVHRSVRTYSDRPVDEETVTALMGAALSAATSSNLHLWSVISVQEPERRQRIAAMCGNQEQVRNAPWFFAFLADHHRVRHAARKVGESAEGLGFTEFLVMAVIDAALAAERFVCAAESLGLGICYIGALRNDPPGVKDLLALPDGVFGVFGLTLGWPAEPLPAHIKSRMDLDSVWFKERYKPDPDLSSFEKRMREFYESEGMRGDFTWSKRSGRRVDRHHLTGREVLNGWLAAQGINVE